MSKNKKSNITKHPKLHIAQKKHPNNKTPKKTKSPNLQNVQSYKMSEATKCP